MMKWNTPAMYTRLAFAVICLWVVLGGHWPPAASAQYQQHEPVIQTQLFPVLTSEDAVQDSKIAELFDSRDKGAVSRAKLTDMVNANTSAISGIQGEERGIGALLLLLQVVSMVQASRKAKA